MQDSKRDSDVKNRLLDSVGEGEGGMLWENSVATCIIICEIDHQSRFNAWSRGIQSWCSGMTQRDSVEREVGGASGWGTHVQPWLIHVGIWQNHCNILIRFQFQRKAMPKNAQTTTQLHSSHTLVKQCLKFQIIFPWHCFHGALLQIWLI